MECNSGSNQNDCLCITAPAGREAHLSQIGRTFLAWQEKVLFNDTFLTVHGDSVATHLVVLAAHSGYFERILRSNPSLPLHLDLSSKKLTVLATRKAIEFAYGGSILVTSSCLLQILQAADVLEMKQLRALCDRYLLLVAESTSGPTALTLANSSLVSEAMREQVMTTVANNFDNMSVESLNSLDARTFCRLLQSDELVVADSAKPLTAAIHWLLDVPGRIEHFERVTSVAVESRSAHAQKRLRPMDVPDQMARTPRAPGHSSPLVTPTATVQRMPRPSTRSRSQVPVRDNILRRSRSLVRPSTDARRPSFSVKHEVH